MKARIDRRVAFAACWLFAGLAGVGCRNCDAVEAELRIRDQQNLALRAKLRQTELNNMLLQREMYEQRTVLPPGAGPQSWKLPPEVVGSSSVVQRISLGRLTGGHSSISGAGDDSLEVVVEPRDAGDRVLKAPGTLQVAALEITPEGVKRPIGTWDLSADQLAAKWRGGLFGSAYNLILPWQQQPASSQVRVVVRFTTPEGKTFEAERDVTIRPESRPNAPAEKSPEPQGPILSRVFSFWKKTPAEASPPQKEDSLLAVTPAVASQPFSVAGPHSVTPAGAPEPTWQPADPLPVATRLMPPVPIPDSR
jgi:hypothetical protein